MCEHNEKAAPKTGINSVQESGQTVLQAIAISKSFPGVRALSNVDLSLKRGCLTALLGANGAGKSTLMNILSGVFSADEGTVFLDGKPVIFESPCAAQDAGIVMIYQELNLVNTLSVAENIFLGREPVNMFGMIDTDKIHSKTAQILKEVDLDIHPATPLHQLRVGQQQLVEIAKALSTNARVLIMDEPTSAITEREIDVLFKIIQRLKSQGVAIVYITHKLEELTSIADDVVVMRDGHLVCTAALAELSTDEIVQLIVGQELVGQELNVVGQELKDDTHCKAVENTAEISNTRSNKTEVHSKEALRVERVSLKNLQRSDSYAVRNVSFSAYKGEVVGIFGLIGAGRTELLEAIFGMFPRLFSGRVFVDGAAVSIGSPVDAIAHGLALVPEDRKRDGLVLGRSVSENVSLACLKKMSQLGFINKKKEKALTDSTVEKFKVKLTSTEHPIRDLSGGNQQKIILGKWLATQPKVLLLDEPTRGIDVNAKSEIYSLLHQLSNDGMCVVFVSSEISEILTVSDRIIVLCEGEKTAEFDSETACSEAVLQAALPKN